MSSICFYAWNRNLHALRHSIVIHCCPGAAAAASAAGPLKQLLKNDHKRYGGGGEDRHLAGLCSTYDTIYEAHTIFMCHILISGQFNSCDSVVVPAFIALLLGKVDEKLSLSLSLPPPFVSISIRRVCINVASRQRHRQRSNFLPGQG